MNTESRRAPHSTCNRRRMTTMAWVRSFARRIKHKSVRLQTFRRCLPAQNQLADLSELPQHSATHHKHTHQVSIAQSMYPLEKSRFKWETTKVRLHLSAMLFSNYLSGEYLLHIPCWHNILFGEFDLHIPCWLHFYLGNVSYTSRACIIFLWGVSLTHHFYLGSFSYTSHAGFFLYFFIFLLHIPCWLYFHVGSFFYTSHGCFVFLWGVSLTHTGLFSFNLGRNSYTSRAGFIFYLGSFSYKSHACISFFGEFPLHISCWLLFSYLGSFSYISRAGFFFMWGVSLTHPVLASLAREFF